MSPTRNPSVDGLMMIYSEGFKQAIQEKVNDRKFTTEEYASKARAYIGSIPFDTDIPFTNVKADSILMNMLEYARMCGGDSGTRYVACAIVDCGTSVEPLAALASDWLKFFLWPCKLRSVCAH